MAAVRVALLLLNLMHPHCRYITAKIRYEHATLFKLCCRSAGSLAVVEPRPLVLGRFSGLLYLPWMVVIVEQLVGRMFGRGNRSTRRKPSQVPQCPPQESHFTCRRCGKPPTNHLSYDTDLAQAVRCRFPTAAFRVQSRVISSVGCHGQSGI
jgi:ribosomal protein L37E